MKTARRDARAAESPILTERPALTESPILRAKVECAELLVGAGIRNEHQALSLADRLVEAVLRHVGENRPTGEGQGERP